MDIHKPKPIHNLRELMKEVGIIVLGVSIALAAEQAVEWVHWRNQVREARAALAVELAYDLGFAMQRLKTYDCVEQRLDLVTDVLDKASVTGSLPPLAAISSPIFGTWSGGVWNTVVASQTATHFPRNELNRLGSICPRLGKSFRLYDQRHERT